MVLVTNHSPVSAHWSEVTGATRKKWREQQLFSRSSPILVMVTSLAAEVCVVATGRRRRRERSIWLFVSDERKEKEDRRRGRSAAFRRGDDGLGRWRGEEDEGKEERDWWSIGAMTVVDRTDVRKKRGGGG
ncbi:hypothetical protein HAX54_020048 [Datura stramonium]|uniref:Uncharacterized protein n=1 Tax=Datura stramonium TaxID=4076 RepID=A0ABS8UQG3_DATST|nr:hypothetical protein [Datura stramonium]